MDVTIKKSSLKGIINLPPSKSYTHRALICAFLSRGRSIIKNPLISEDIKETIKALTSLGARIEVCKDYILLDSRELLENESALSFAYSASSIRMLFPLLCFFKINKEVIISEALKRRITTEDFSEVKKALENKTIFISTKKTTQFLSGVLLILPLLGKDVKVETDMNDSLYLQMTVEMMRLFGVNIKTENKMYWIESGNYQESKVTIESDLSNGALWLALSGFNPDLIVKGINFSSLQGDLKVISYLESMGYNFIKNKDEVRSKNIEFKSSSFSLSNSLDLAPILASVAALSGKEVEISGITNLQYKESNRLEAIYNILLRLGYQVSKTNDSILINGRTEKKSNIKISAMNDHRLVMMLIILSLETNNLIIDGFESCSKSYPDLLDDFKKVNGDIKII